jgi:2'-hydroxyisoflavone reductase
MDGPLRGLGEEALGLSSALRVAGARENRPMQLLVLGGTLFVGRHVVEAALARGHAVAILNRGRTDPGDWPALDHVERLVGDRDGDLSALHGRAFDAVIDCTGFTAAQLRRTADALAASPPPHYVFISSISAYASFPPGLDFDEDAPLAQGEGTYGADKARAEEAIAAALPGHVAIVRPGLVVGPLDPTNRFTYWPVRIARGGRVLAPGQPGHEVHVIDARDLAAWCVTLAERRTTGTFNAVGPWVAMGELLARCRALTGAAATFDWRSDAALLAAGVAPWTGLPLWLPVDDAGFGGMMRARNERAIAAGLVPRPIDETISDTLAWARSPQARAPKAVATLSPEREAEILAGDDGRLATT